MSSKLERAKDIEAARIAKEVQFEGTPLLPGDPHVASIIHEPPPKLYIIGHARPETLQPSDFLR